MIRKPAIGLGSSVGSCSDSLRAGRSGDRIPMEAWLFALVNTSPEASIDNHLYSGYRVSAGVKAAGT